MSKGQTDNDKKGFEYKVSLRLHSLPNKKIITVLDCYHGHGHIWAEVKKRTDKTINVTPIDTRSDKTKPYLKGNNIKFLKSMDLSRYDLIDLDAYGIPFAQMQLLFQRGYKGVVHVTYIQTGMGKLSYKLLNECGYTDEMIKKIPTLFSKNGIEKICNYLKKSRINRIFLLSLNRKNYFYYQI